MDKKLLKNTAVTTAITVLITAIFTLGIKQAIKKGPLPNEWANDV